MPNWCDNIVTISHPDPAELQRLLDAVNSGRLLSTYIPEPASLEKGGLVSMPDGSQVPTMSQPQWEWRIANWGVKWEITDRIGEATLQDGKVRFRFDSPWSPPIPLWIELDRQGFEVTALYFEPGMGFCGRFSDGTDKCFEESIATDAPRDIAVAFNFEDFYGEENAEGRDE